MSVPEGVGGSVRFSPLCRDHCTAEEVDGGEALLTEKFFLMWL